MENLINKTNFGLIYSVLNDLEDKIWELIEEPRNKCYNLNSFKDFSELLIKKI